MGRAKKAEVPVRSATEVRTILLQYFYDRNQKATSARGKQGFAVKIMDARKELKDAHGLSQQEVIGNLNYLISQGWLVEEQIEKSVPLASGTVIPQSTSFYKITAPGIDKIEGPGAFTMDKFSGIKIEATGHNVITVGDGNIATRASGTWVPRWRSCERPLWKVAMSPSQISWTPSPTSRVWKVNWLNKNQIGQC